MLKFAALVANCLTNNLRKFHQKILNYSENNEIFVGRGGVFWPHPVEQCIHFNARNLFIHAVDESEVMQLSVNGIVR